jgi:hypothetical protein
MAKEKSLLQEALENCDYECRSYSGRAMYGQRCLAVEVDEVGIIAKLGFDVSEYLNGQSEDSYQTGCQLGKAKWDNMGRGYVIYFPSVDYVEETCDDSDGEECSDGECHCGECE